MSRNQRRLQKKKTKKDAMSVDNFISNSLALLKESLPNYEFTLIMAEKEVPEDEDRDRSFTFASTGDNSDLTDALAAFIAKHNPAAGETAT